MSDPSGRETAISVLIPSYNPGQYFREALQSALGQLGPHDEIVVQDAESTDGSPRLLAELAASDSRVKPVVERDSGQSDALNRALRRARNPWVLWLNADDVLLTSALDRLRAALDADDSVDVVVGGHELIRADGSRIDTFNGRPLDARAIVTRGCAAFSGSILVKTELLRRVGGFERELNTAMDLALQLEIAAARPRQVLIADPIGALRFHDASKSANLWREFVREGHEVRMRHADGVRQQAAALLMTARHLVESRVFRLRLTPEYRIWRRRVLRVMGR
ncbi:glycosyltransferase [Mycobacterium yunnanensis]|nr:glycosyltransferase [Mycobacterium yunnanensis]